MNPKTLLLVSAVLIFGQSYGEANLIRPSGKTSVSITEGHNVTLSCTYYGSVYSLHWYRQMSGSRPEFLHSFSAGGELLARCCFKPSTKPSRQRCLEGSPRALSVSANHSTGARYRAFCQLLAARAHHWSEDFYSWHMDCPPLVLIVESTKSVIPSTPPQPHMSIRLQNKQVDLEISSAAVSDSALYYCAMEPTVTGNTTTLYKNIYTFL
ncbi:uncharacterized protein [Misgurnus anguillicaudatus]|uniref:uncharacterized protein n=1 Tax=Misgurnus anguillicaudatus TaxID=75329 RepID=UPI003CCFA8BD